MTTTIHTGTQEWAVQNINGRTYITTTARGVVYTISQSKWSWEVATARTSLRNGIGGCTHHRSAAEVAASRKALRNLPVVLDVIADDIAARLDAIAAQVSD